MRNGTKRGKRKYILRCTTEEQPWERLGIFLKEYIHAYACENLLHIVGSTLQKHFLLIIVMIKT